MQGGLRSNRQSYISMHSGLRSNKQSYVSIHRWEHTKIFFIVLI